MLIVSVINKRCSNNLPYIVLLKTIFFLKLNFMEQHSFTGFMTGVIAELELRMAMATVTMT